ncbi:MAG: 5'/3'-nucleotidase SurE [Snodgrassella sp.]|uniref:5'/3'-nucleotidase SurE n=1 Tax=Snodgrassella TaxID=1193515 RepID=UPI001EF3EE84|nr:MULTISPECIES: 5'/3'-nucleotidase SurE [Snodgrassella]MCO6513724.1 5'/3'-nucleotidase SurE [Snodgrassella sp.]MCO6522129.1 5'/3'-nucleotidase SurE [Snodgrassella sp.]MCO6526565.1 5'/3'-nucleotidase SurE [Snodgrassella sp.]
MKILICNDDGYLSAGIALLAKVAAQFAEVRVVAPESDQSGVSNSFTLNRPLSIKKASNGFYYVNGTPTDCIHVALHTMADFKPDLVLSGINHGANMGDDVLYSGTVAAATEAFLMGIPALAFSINDRSGQYWATAEKAVHTVLARVCAQPAAEPVLWNINIPAVNADAVQGYQVAKLGRRHHDQCIVPFNSPRGETMYWIGGVGAADTSRQDTDFCANEAGFVTITPLTLDLTNYQQLGTVNTFLQDIQW